MIYNHDFASLRDAELRLRVASFHDFALANGHSRTAEALLEIFGHLSADAELPTICGEEKLTFGQGRKCNA